MTFPIEGLDELQKKLEEMQRKAEELDGGHSVPISELLTPEFLAECSSFSTVEELFEASGFKVGSPEDFEAIPDSDWEWFIQQNTSYTSWSEMLQDASQAWAVKKMDL
jgi:hypothetical protein